MSAMKDYALDCTRQQETMDEAVTAAMLEAMTLANLAWGNGDDRPVWAPDESWLDEMSAMMGSLMMTMSELRAAADSI